ncbi:MAG TPA: hypothetical protein VIJ20_06025, partial [Solirubrobacteraceae bacterium]
MKLASLAAAAILAALLALNAGGGGRAHAAPASSSVEVVITSANLRDALTPMPDVAFSSTDPGGPIISVDEGAREQRIKGFGGAMTDTSA